MLRSEQKYKTEDEIAEIMMFRWMCKVTREDKIRKEFDKSRVGKEPAVDKIMENTL